MSRAIFLAAVQAARELRAPGRALYLLYSSERRCAWVGTANVLRPEPGSLLLAAFNGFFLIAPDPAAAVFDWPGVLLLAPEREVTIDERSVTASDAPSTLPSLGEGSMASWRGETDGEYARRLERAITLTHGRAGKIIATRGYERDRMRGADPLELARLLGDAEPDAAAVHYVEVPGGPTSMGTSPENVVELHDGVLSVDAVAGTRPSGRTPAADQELEAELLASPKERREHAMAVERARAFAARVCAPDGVRLTFERRVRKLRAVQHLHSRVEGRLLAELDFTALLARCHPPLVSYPDELAAEVPAPWQGRYYGGMLGRVAPGAASSFLNLRCVEVDGDVVRTYGGVGVVDGSSVEGELAEVQSKLRTVSDCVERWLQMAR
jgi:anthranilate/para-aminobenzoate synthase component I